jgi:hypothetical protein
VDLSLRQHTRANQEFLELLGDFFTAFGLEG